MRSEIIENISETLLKPLEKERVVYLMVEIRKLTQQSKEESIRWKNLVFWCDWVVHSKMDRKFAKDTLTTMEQYLKIPKGKFHWSDFNSNFISLETLRWELYEFLKNINLPTEIVNIPPWDSFTMYLVENLRDCNLSKNIGLIREFRFIKKNHIPEAEKYSIDYEVCFDESYKNFTGSVLRFDKKR